jgi:hypothetical protein
MFKLFSDIYFVVYKLYYVGQNDDLDIRVSSPVDGQVRCVRRNRAPKFQGPQIRSA